MACPITLTGISVISGRTRGEIPSKFLSKTNPRNRTSFRRVGDEEKKGISVRVCSSTKDRVVRVSDFGQNERVSDFGQNERVSWQFSALMKQSSSKQNKEDEEKQNYYVNTGYAIRALREEFPQIFNRELSFDIYRDDIVFKDPINTFVGIDNYKSIFWALRFQGRIFFKALWVDIGSVWQPVESVIMIRWTIHGLPRIPWESHGRFDGTSEYKLDKNGKIFEHRVDNIAFNSPPKFRILAVEELILSIGCPSTPKPTYFEIFHHDIQTILGEVHMGEASSGF